MRCMHCQKILYPYQKPFQTDQDLYFICEYCFQKHPILIEHQQIFLNKTDITIMHIIIESNVSIITAMHYLSLIQKHSYDLILWLEENEIEQLILYDNINIGNIYIYHVEKNNERWFI